jgi:drug/metabolite transporter (DMT)-like permease
MPVAALATSALYLGETIGPARLTGAALVIAGIVLGALSPKVPK